MNLCPRCGIAYRTMTVCSRCGYSDLEQDFGGLRIPNPPRCTVCPGLTDCPNPVRGDPQPHPDPALREFYYAGGHYRPRRMAFGEETFEITVLRRLYALETKCVDALRTGLHLADRGDIPAVKRTLRNALEEFNRKP